MPRKKTTRKRTRRRGAGIRDWVHKAHNMIRAKNGYSRALSYGYQRYGMPLISSRLSESNARLVNAGVQAGLRKLKQQGYGLRRAGNGLRRAGNGLRRAGEGRRMKY